MNKKKWIGLALLTAIALFLVGCTPATPAPTTPPAAEASPTTLEEKAAEVVATAEAAVEGAVEDAKKAAEEVAEEVKEKVEDAKEAVEKAAEEVAEKAEEAVEAVKDVVAGEEKPLLLTLEELKEYNGKDGKRAYVAVDGIIYDMTDSVPWKDGAHNGFEAGNDLTKEIKEVSPHGIGKLENVVEIGVLKQ